MSPDSKAANAELGSDEARKAQKNAEISQFIYKLSREGLTPEAIAPRFRAEFKIEDSVTDERLIEVVKATIEYFQRREQRYAGVKKTEQDEKQVAACAAVDEWLDGKKELTSEEVVKHCQELSKINRADRRTKVYKKLGWKADDFDENVTPAPKAKEEKPLDLEDALAEDLKPCIRELLDVEASDRRDLGLPISNDAVMSQVSETVWNHLALHSAVFCANGLGYIITDAVVSAVSPDDPNFNEVLEKYGLRPLSPAADAVGKYINQKCVVFGRATDVRVGFYYDADQRIAYLAHRPGWFLAITKDDILDEPNGNRDILFTYPKDFKPLAINLKKLPKVERALDPPPGLLDDLIFVESSLTTVEKKRLIMAYILSLLMSGSTAGRAILMTLGGTGSGKTFLQRVIGRLLAGPGFDVTSPDVDAKEFDNKLVNNVFVCLDDVDFVSKEIKAAIRRAVTGGKLIRRELYTAMGQVEMPYKAALGLTAIVSPFSDEEIANRALSFELPKREGYKDELDLLREIDQKRDELMANLIARVQRVIAALDQEQAFKPTVQNRMASFATFLLRISRFEGWEKEAETMLDHWRQEQESAVFDSGNELAETIDRYLLAPSVYEQPFGCKVNRKVGVWLSAGDLYDELKPFVRGDIYEFKNSMTLAHALERSAGAFQKRYGFSSERPTSKPRRYRLSPSEDQLKAIKGY